MKQHISRIGNVDWSDDDIRNSIPDFMELYKSKPISDNQGGMKSPHMFATWYMLKKLNPAVVIESGVWKGQGTWLIEKTLPEAKIYAIDVKLSHREYISKNVIYYQKDFSKIDWSVVKNKENAVLFFDDHQNALERVKQAKMLGFKHLIFEDNYPASQGDCYSLKKAFMHAGFTPEIKKPDTIKSRIAALIKPVRIAAVEPNNTDAEYLKEVLDIYFEFPPVYKNFITRWKDSWNSDNYPTPEPLFVSDEHPDYPIFSRESIHYTWICYARLK